MIKPNPDLRSHESPSAPSSILPSPNVFWSRNVFLSALACTLLGITVSTWTSATANEPGFELHHRSNVNLWFEADIPRVYENMTDLQSNHYRTSVHPISSLILAPITVSLTMTTGATPVQVARGVVGILSAISAGLLLLTMHRFGLSLFAATTFCFIYLSSAAYIHWSGVIELVGPNSFTMTVGLAFLAYGPTQRSFWWVIASATTLCMTTTHWLVGLSSAWFRLPRRQAIMVSLSALFLISGLSLIQKSIFHEAELFFLPKSIIAEKIWITPASAQKYQRANWSLHDSIRSLLVTSIIAPPPYVYSVPTIQDGREKIKQTTVNNQKILLSQISWSAIIASILWVCLFCGGLLTLLTKIALRPFGYALSVMLVAQTILHSVYGDITFLYSLNIAPLLTAIAAFSWFAVPKLSMVFAWVLIPLALTNNSQHFLGAMRLAKEHALQMASIF
ncbi:MAG: hypothetical protein KTR25_06645 [Myxococcales bacterium]|nr:hypothetical protein [Myxococcales bacterium]